MKTTVYLVRHGQSYGNLDQIFYGQTEVSLTDLGVRQAERTAKELKDVPFDAIYSSDLSRAYNTALPHAQLRGMEIQTDPGLREIYVGAWEGRPFVDLRADTTISYGVWRTNMGRAEPEGGESFADIQKRVADSVKKIAEANVGKTVLIVTHATPIRSLYATHLGLTLDEVSSKTVWAGNASYSVCEYEDGKLTFLSYGVDDYLKNV